MELINKVDVIEAIKNAGVDITPAIEIAIQEMPVAYDLDSVLHRMDLAIRNTRSDMRIFAFEEAIQIIQGGRRGW